MLIACIIIDANNSTKDQSKMTPEIVDCHAKIFILIKISAACKMCKWGVIQFVSFLASKIVKISLLDI